LEIFTNRKNDTGISIRIKDNGSGIAEDAVNCVYDPLVTSKTNGTGLGLTTVHQIIKNHNRETKIKSKKTEGTDVNIFLPLRHDKRAA
jgi:nitrogen-specific signal transduction histidine kinase